MCPQVAANLRPRSPAARRAEIAAVFDRVAEQYGDGEVDWFGPVARRLVDLLEPVPGERAVDLGCGRGASLFELAAALGTTGQVRGIDLSPNMIRCTAADPRMHAAGSAPIELQVMDAAAPMLPEASAELVSASFLLFFLPAPVPALRAWCRLLVPGGRLGVSTFDQHRGGWLSEALLPYLPASGGERAQPASPYDSEAGLRALLEAAGFDGIQTSTFEIPLVFKGVAQWYGWSWSHGQRAVWERIPATSRAQAVAEVADRLHRLRGPGGAIEVTQRVHCAVARRPVRPAVRSG